MFPSQKAISVRYPFVIGKDDYTKRLYFYIEHTIKQIPMHIDNLNAQLGFTFSHLKNWIYDLIDCYIEDIVNA